MPRFAEAELLVPVGLDAFGREARLAPAAAGAWHAMRAAAAANGVTLILLSAFRGIARQGELVAKKLTAGATLEEILRVNAYPGFSEHHTGRAVDLGSPACEPLTEAFARTQEFSWLDRRASDFGFRLTYPRKNTHGIAYEPWHWCWSSNTEPQIS